MELLGHAEPHKAVLNNKIKTNPKNPKAFNLRTPPIKPKPWPYHIPEAVPPYDHHQAMTSGLVQ